MGRDYLGEFEHLLLLAVMRLGENAHGGPIRELIAERAEREVSFGAVYSTMRRLEAKGYLRLQEEASVGEAGGRPRRIASITPAGEDAIRAAQLRLQRMAEGVLES